MSHAVFVLVKATMLAREAGLAEVGIAELLRAIDSEATVLPTPTGGGAFEPVPKFDAPLSPAAIPAIASCGDLERLSMEELRAALIRAVENDDVQ